MNKASTAVFALAQAVLAAAVFSCAGADETYYNEYTVNQTLITSYSTSGTGDQTTVSISGTITVASTASESGEAVTLTLEGYCCTGSGNVWLCQSEEECGATYVVTLVCSGEGEWTCTVQSVCSSEATGESDEVVVVLWLEAEGADEVLFVTVDGTACEATEEGGWVYEAGGTTYSIVLTKGESGEWTFDLTLTQESTDEDDADTEGDSIDDTQEEASEDTEGEDVDDEASEDEAQEEDETDGDSEEVDTYDSATMEELIASIEEGCTVVLPSDTSEEDLAKLISAIAGYSGVTLDMSAASLITSISANAFEGCSGLVCVTLPDELTSIEGYAFYGCTALTSLAISESATTIGQYALRECTSLEAITLPSGTSGLGQGALYGCSALVSIAIPEGVAAIKQYTFSGCSSLESVELYSSTESVGKYAFNGCTSLTSVTYHGTKAQWATLVGDGESESGIATGNTCLTAAKITCSDGVYGDE